MSQLVIEPVTFRIVAQCLNQLRYRVSHWLLVDTIMFLRMTLKVRVYQVNDI